MKEINEILIKNVTMLLAKHDRNAAWLAKNAKMIPNVRLYVIKVLQTVTQVVLVAH